ncbi:MAG: nucleoside hydrolase [Hyphomonadaceae bacterium]|nr:MAG: purine nucleosidase [Caulobacteraceae bacterium]MBT9445552.1 nucleoside hydrolase [Hyphomonadaceae bacterium]TPW04816.1 MAG: purine nucleosidase [Alphaproteobacteria bacterium]
MTARPLIIDCDPGVDDAIALFLAFASPDALDVRAITTVAGNVGGALTARNARLIRELAGRADVPVYAGCERPMVRAPVDAGDFHGESGLGNLPVFEPSAPQEQMHAVMFLIEALMAAPTKSVTLAITGPMTNVAMAFVLAPQLAGRVAEIVVMGGARAEGGNITSSAEYNIYADPHAAHVVFSSGAPIVAFGLDVTHQVRSTPARIDAIRAIGTPASRASADLLEFSAGVERNIPGVSGAPLHDPCTIAYLLSPNLFRLAPCAIVVETGEGVALGHTSVELRDMEFSSMRWATHADDEGVFALLLERLRA